MQGRSSARVGVAIWGLLVVSLAGAAIAQNNQSSKTTAAGTQMTLSKTDIAASPEAVFGVVDYLRSWSKWTWPHKGEVKRTYSGPAKGKGAVYEWDSPGAGGSGRAQIIESSEPGRVVVDLDLKGPVAGHLTWVFRMERVGDKTEVSISTSGPSKLVSSGFATLLGPSPSLIRLGCVAGGEPYKSWCEVFMIRFFEVRKAKAAKP